MAHLDLEEQEQLDQLKHFWKQYGNLITWLLITVLAIYAGWNGYQYWQRSQAAQAAALYEEIERFAKAEDSAKLERALSDMKERFASTTYAQQAGLLAAKAFVSSGKPDAAQAALRWVAEKSGDEGYQAIARLRLAGLLLEAKAYEEALKPLAANFPPDFVALVADRRGDVLLAQGKRAEAGAEYLKAYQALDESAEYRRLIDVKLTGLGLQPRAEPVVAAGDKK